jgi:hypothetical protein
LRSCKQRSRAAYSFTIFLIPMHYSTASGSSLLSLVCWLLVCSIFALSASAWLDSAVMTRHIRHESSRLALFLTELIIASSNQNKPIPLTLKSGSLTAQIGDISHTFTPKHGTELSLPESDSATLREIRYARSCSPTTFKLTKPRSLLSCSTTLSLRCRVRTICKKGVAK